MRDKLFASANSKKGLLVEIEEDSLKFSIWKKETPTSIIINKNQGHEIALFINNELFEDGTDEDGKYWDEYTKKIIEERVGKFPEDLPSSNAKND
jgi:hypothetical protein